MDERTPTLKDLIKRGHTGSAELYLPLGIAVFTGTVRLAQGKLADVRVLLGGSVLSGSEGIRAVEERAELLLAVETEEEGPAEHAAGGETDTKRRREKDARKELSLLDALQTDVLRDYL